MNDTVHENDNVTRDEVSVTEEEASGMNTEKWFQVKMELQDFLCRKELEDYPAFANDAAWDWIGVNGKMFDLFYERMRTEKPNLLIRWWMQTSDDNEVSNVEFLQEWSRFKSSQPK